MKERPILFSTPMVRAILAGTKTQTRRVDRADVPAGDERLSRGWRPSIHMPRWASRITLEVTGVRVERVCDITSNDARCEGVDAEPGDVLRAFERLWNGINADRGFGWAVNPWVWCVSFKRLALGCAAARGGR